MTTKIRPATVKLKLPMGRTLELVPTVAAAEAISDRFEGFALAHAALASFRWSDAVFVVAAGAGVPDDETDGLNEELLGVGVIRTTAAANEYIKLLMRGGQSEERAKTQKGTGQGN